MTTINNTLSSVFTALDGQKKTNATQAETLADVLGNTTTPAETPNISDAVDLNLSDEAKAMLDKASPIFTDFSGDRFVLNQRQRATIESIIQKYKDAPFDQDTYESLMTDLDHAGLSPETLSIKDKVLAINPVGIFLAAMSGQDTSSAFNPFGDTSDEALETKSNNFMLDVVARWHEISTYEEPADTDVADTEVAATEES